MKVNVNLRVLGATLAVIGVMGSLLTANALISSLMIHQDGTVSMVQAYTDSSLNTTVTAMHWGSLLPDSVQNQTIYLKNFGTKAVTVNPVAVNWSPANASNYFGFTSNAVDMVIPPGIAQSATIFLSVFANITNTTINGFSCDLNVTEAWTP
jgi:hypothetical protein